MRGDGFGDDGIDDAEAVEIGGGDTHRFGGIRGFGRVFPEDGRTGFRRCDRVDGVFQHEDTVGHADGECAAGAAFADDHGDDRRFEAGHGEQALGDGGALTAFLGADAGFGAGGVDECDDRDAKFLGVFHEALGFAISLRTSHAEVVSEVFSGVGAFLVTDDNDRAVLETSQSADEGFVITEPAIAVELDEAGHELVDIGEGVGPGGVPGDLDPVPGCERRIRIAFGELDLGIELRFVGFVTTGASHRSVPFWPSKLVWPLAPGESDASLEPLGATMKALGIQVMLSPRSTWPARA